MSLPYPLLAKASCMETGPDKAVLRGKFTFTQLLLDAIPSLPRAPHNGQNPEQSCSAVDTEMTVQGYHQTGKTTQSLRRGTDQALGASGFVN